jgi:hypothetical protein
MNKAQHAYPIYTVHWKTGHGELIRDFTYIETPIVGYDLLTDKISLSDNGTLHLATGYVWDFGSGPAIDTPDMVYGSLAHDAFYELMVLGLLPWSERRTVDKYFKRLLKDTRMGWLRRQWVYLGVRVGYPVMRALGIGQMGKKPRDRS